MSKATKAKQSLTEGPVGPRLTRMAIPIVLGIVSIMFFNVVDTFWVSKISTDHLAAMTFTFPIVFVIFGSAIGMGIGTTSVISRVVGENKPLKVQELCMHAMLLALLVVTVLAALGLVTMESLFHWLGASPSMLGLIREYMTIWYVGVPLLALTMSGNACVRATGDTRIPGMVMFCSSLVNAVLDPILIFGWGPIPAFGMAGAAYATVVSWGMGLLFVLHTVITRYHLLVLNPIRLGCLLHSWRRFLSIGVPAAGTQVLTPLATGIMTSLVATYGEQAVAGFGVGCRIEPIALVAVIALTSALNPFIGQNWGAGRMDRVHEALRVSFRFAMMLGLLMVPLLAFAAPYLGQIFSSDAETLRVVRSFFYIYPISYGAEGMVILAGAAFNALQLPLRATALNIFRLLGLYIPLAYVGSLFWGVGGIFIGGSVANLVSGLIAYVWVKQTLAHVPQPPEEPSDQPLESALP